MGHQRPRVAQPAEKSSPGVFTLWPCPERIPKRARPGILFPSKASMEEESPGWREMGECGGEGARAGPPFSEVEISPKWVEDAKIGGRGHGTGVFPGPGPARGSRLGGGGSSRALAEPPLRRLPLKGASARASAEGLRLSSKIGKNWEAARDQLLAAQTSPGASLPIACIRSPWQRRAAAADE